MKIKPFLLLACCLLCQLTSSAQRSDAPSEKLPLVGISKNSTLHFLSPEHISYVDISTAGLKGDLPMKNILRVKIATDSVSRVVNNADAGMVTVVGESFIAQYRLYFLPPWECSGKPTVVEILPGDCRPLQTGTSMSTPELRAHAMAMLGSRGKQVRKEENYGIALSVNQLFAAGEYIFIDLGIENHTNLPFDIDELSFAIDDKKITKATNVQSVAVVPFWQLHYRDSFKKSYRNIYVIKKLSYPENKVLTISLKEKQLSGRNLSLKVPYKDILRADTF